MQQALQSAKNRPREDGGPLASLYWKLLRDPPQKPIDAQAHPLARRAHQLKTSPCRAPIRVKAYGCELVREYIRSCNHGTYLETLGNFAQRLAANPVVASLHIEHEVHRPSCPRSMKACRLELGQHVSHSASIDHGVVQAIQGGGSGRKHQRCD